ncbi:hypothetical protein ABZ847_29285 [Streptomyces bauhiniae]
MTDPSPVTAWWTAATPDRRHYAGRHHTGPAELRDPAGRLQIATPVGPEYSPLRPADRVALAPHHWADDTRWLSAPGEEERTGRLDTDAVRAQAAAPPEWPGPDGAREVLAGMRAELLDPAQTAGAR